MVELNTPNVSFIPGMYHVSLKSLLYTSFALGDAFCLTYKLYFLDILASQITFSDGDAAYDRYPSALEVPWNYYEGCQAFVPANAKPARIVLDTLLFLYQVRSFFYQVCFICFRIM